MKHHRMHCLLIGPDRGVQLVSTRPTLSDVIEPGENRPPTSSPVFATTHWSVVHAAQDKSDRHCAAALEMLCRTYWYPLYAFVRRRGHSPHDAEDLTQSFFARLLDKNYLASVDATKGTFRTFLLTALKRFMADEYDRAQAKKRGGGRQHISLDLANGEDQYQLDLGHDLTPDRLFERQWALTVLNRARTRLQHEYEAAGKGALYERLKGFHQDDATTVAYADLALDLAVSQNTLKSHVHRLRKRYRQLVRDEIAQTVSNAESVEEEIRHLIVAMGG